MRRAKSLTVDRAFYLLLVLSLVSVSPLVSRAEDKLNYNRDIRPLLADHCFACHGPSKASRKADLRLDQREAAIEMAAIAPGKPNESELVNRIMSVDADEVMPPPETKKTLTADQKSLLARWIREGAEYQKHWSFLAPTRHELPAVSRKDWPRNPIDYFTLARLEAEGLQPSPEASREVLIRRVSYDLTGLPPTLADLDRFMADASSGWYEKTVDYYLQQESFGERMALAWMDASRYGDTSVFHADGPRDMWPWRDWVINAYNANKPFDQFTIEQLAGDLLPNATPHQMIASAFNRNHATTDEGGAIAEEWRVDYVVDRVKTTSNVWLGISMECGQCHEHKYDPISQRDYYRFFAFFNQTTDPGMQTRNGNQAPVVNVPNTDVDKKVSEAQQQLAAIEQQLKQRVNQVEEPFRKWLLAETARVAAGEAAMPPADAVAHFPLDEGKGNKVTDLIDSKRQGNIKGKQLWTAGKHGGGLQISGNSFVALGDTGNFDRSEAVSYGCWVKPKGKPNGVPLGKMNEGNAHRGWDLYVANGQVAVHVIHSWPANAIKVTTKAQIPADKWTHLFATYDGSGKAAGVKIYFNGQAQEWDVNANSLTGTTKSKVPLKIGRRNNSAQFNGIVDDVRLYGRAISQTEVAAIAGSDPIAPLLATAPEQRTPEQVATLKSHYLNHVDSTNSELKKNKAKLTADVAALKKQVVTCMVMKEQPKPRETYVLMRGHYASPDKSEVIKPDVPSVFPSLAESAPRNRLGLAQWLVDDRHPLTARVTVNRYWSLMFGRGLVSTVMDFGSQGAWPSHRELLDWLAVDFRENRWNIKHALKQMLMSATYRQSSRVTPDLAARDPENLLLARGPRYRLPGEAIRDMNLAVSGLLVDTVGGPGVRPYQPPGLWNEVSLSGARFKQDAGDKLYRKSMYIYWKRSSPHPGMRIFDAPTREKCVVQRPRTNTPLQALYTMNGVQFVEAARALAQRMIQEGGDSSADRIAYAHRLITSRHPSDRTVKILAELFEAERKKYQNDEAAAKKLLGIGEFKRDESIGLAEHAAWTVVANVLLNMDAALTKF